MNRALLVATVLRRLTRHPGRSAALGLGVALAVAVTVVLSTAATRVERKFLSFIDRAYPADSVVVFAGSGPMGGGGRRGRLGVADVEVVASTLGLADWDPVVYAGGRDVARQGRTARVSLLGYSEKAEVIRRRGVDQGEFFSAAEVRSRARVALLGRTAVERLFPGESPVGQTVFLDNAPFVVKGVLESVGVDPHGGDQDLAIHVPYTVLLDRLRTVELSGVTFRVPDRARIDEVASEMTRLLRREHQISEGQVDDFTVITPRAMRAMFARSFRTVRVFVPLIEGTAFAVAAFALFGILQAGLRSRVAEIGLRKAVGGRTSDIARQIVLETLAVAALAAGVGLALAPAALAALAPLLAERMGVEPGGPAPLAMVLATGVALLTSLLGGWLPARRAARLRPVDALRAAP